MLHACLQVLECGAIGRVFGGGGSGGNAEGVSGRGEAAYGPVAVSSTKGAVGHLLGAAAAPFSCLFLPSFRSFELSFPCSLPSFYPVSSADLSRARGLCRRRGGGSGGSLYSAGTQTAATTTDGEPHAVTAHKQSDVAFEM